MANAAPDYHQACAAYFRARAERVLAARRHHGVPVPREVRRREPYESTLGGYRRRAQAWREATQSALDAGADPLALQQVATTSRRLILEGEYMLSAEAGGTVDELGAREHPG